MPDRHRDDDRRLHRPAVGALPGHPRPRVGGHRRRGRGGRASPSTVGDRVVCEGFIVCHRCRRCRSGETQWCERIEALGFTRPGGYAELVAVPEQVVHRLPEHVSFDAGVLVEPASVVLRGLEKAGPKPGEAVGVIGVGTLGALAIALLAASLAVADRRLRRARGGARARAPARRHRGRPRGRGDAGRRPSSTSSSRPRAHPPRSRSRRSCAGPAAGPCCSGSPARAGR